MQPSGDGDGGVQSARLAGVSLCRRCTGPLSHRRDRAGGDAELSVRAGRGAAVVHGRTGILPRTLLARPQDSADGGRSADDRRGPAADPAIDVAGAARPERRAARHCGGHVVHGAGQPTTGRPRRAHHPPRPQCHRRAGLSGPGQRAPAGLAGDLGARRVAEDRACAARSIRCAAAVRGSGPRLAPSVAWPAGLGGAAGPRGIVRARLLVRGGGCRRRCARGRRIRRPGALLAGMVLGESDFRHHMESHLRPFRDVLSGLFFVTIGLQLDVAQIVAAPLAVLGWLLALVPLKMGLNFLALRATRLSALDAWRTGIVLGHGGEFALLLLGMVMQQHLVAANVVQQMLVALVLSMGLAPLLIRHHDRWARAFSRSGALGQPPQAEESEVAERARSLRDHVIICGADEVGLLLSRTLRLAGVPHLLLESDRQRVEAGRAMGAPVSYGDASRLDTLAAAGLAHARLVVLTLVRPQTAERIARAVLERRPTLPLVVATDRVTDAQLLRNLPNVRLYPLYLALGLGLAEQVLLMLGINADYVNRRIEELRQTLSESGGDRP